MAGIVREPKVLTELEVITQREVDLYAGHSLNSQLYSINDHEQKIYAVVGVPNLPRPYPSRIVMMAQVIGATVVIIEDITDKPLVDALMINGGIPREQIVLAYKGETVPNTAP